MAEDREQPDEGEAPAPKGGTGRMLIIALASLVVGVAAGLFGVGPLMASRASGAPAEAEEGGHGKSSGGHGESADASYVTLDNLVVNPAETQGTRFLVLTLAVRLSPKGSTTTLQERDPEVRDALIGLLASMTVSELSDVSGREHLKERLKETIESVIGAGTVSSILLPQYVLQ